MQAYAIRSYGGELLRLTLPAPKVGPHDVLVEVRAASLNPIDFKIRDGKVRLLLKYRMPLILGNDCAGIVTEIGPRVTRCRVGDAIYARVPKDRIGTLAEQIAIDENAVALKPPRLSFAEAAALPLVGLTAWQALHDIMQLQPGQKVLIQAGAGGVGTVAIQLAKGLGAYVATTASPAGFELVKSLGADEVIDYRQERFEQVLQDYDGVFDTLGGEALEQAFGIVKPGGHVVSVSGTPNLRFAREYGLPAPARLALALASRRLSQRERTSGATYTFLFMRPSGPQLERLADWVAEDRLRPVIDRCFAFEQTPEAMAYLETGRAKGKVVVEIG